MEPLSINPHDGDTPSYRQLADQLREAIQSGVLAPGDMLPSQNRIHQETGLAKGTIQRGIKVLVDEGLAYTVRGRATYVREHRNRLPPSETSARRCFARG